VNAIICQGSKGGAGRTASSVILATGLAALGHRPLHLQLTLSRIPPAIAFAKSLSFSAAWFPEERATSETIEATIAAHTKCSIVVIDMTRRPFWKAAMADRHTLALLPMRRTAAEIETAVTDYRDIELFRKRFPTPEGTGSPRQYSVRILPITWPQATSCRDLKNKLAAFDAPERDGLLSPNILMPGIPEFSREDLDDLINGSDFQCSEMIADAAVNIARAALQLFPEGQPPHSSSDHDPQ
jgi:hypothetical protein